jgi:two-component system response regulator
VLFANGRPPPFIILMELDLPKLSGFDVLARIRENEDTKRLPVVIFTDSTNQSDADRCYDLCANSYVQKDKDLDRFDTRLKLVLYYWMAVNRNGHA